MESSKVCLSGLSRVKFSWEDNCWSGQMGSSRVKLSQMELVRSGQVMSGGGVKGGQQY